MRRVLPPYLYKGVKSHFFLSFLENISRFGRVCANYHKINYAFIFVVSIAEGHVAVETFADFGEV